MLNLTSKVTSVNRKSVTFSSPVLLSLLKKTKTSPLRAITFPIRIYFFSDIKNCCGAGAGAGAGGTKILCGTGAQTGAVLSYFGSGLTARELKVSFL